MAIQIKTIKQNTTDMNKNTLNIFIVLAVLSLTFSSCKWFGNRKAPRGKNIVCLVDFSESKNASERLQFYMTVIKDNIIPNLGQYDKISVLPIDKASTTNSSDIFINDLSAKDFEPEMSNAMEEEEIIQANLKNYKDSLTTVFANAFQAAIDSRNKSAHGTDIFGALEVVKNSKLKERDENYLIMFSDMMNWSNALNMEPNNRNFNANTIDGLLVKVPNHSMPNLTVLVLTAEQVEVTADHFNLVKIFWTKYFAKNGMKLYDYNSASVTKLNELMKTKIEE